MSARVFIVMTGTTENPIAEHASESLAAAVTFWSQESMRSAGAWLEVHETRRLVGHAELTDSGAASLAARVAAERARMGHELSPTIERAAMPRLGEYRVEALTDSNYGRAYKLESES